MSRNWVRSLAAVTLAWFVIDYLPRPFLWLLPLAAVGCALGSSVVARRSGRLVLASLAVVLFVLVPVEGLLWYWPQTAPSPDEHFEGSYGSAYFVDDPVLGYGPRRGFRTTSRKHIGTSVVYDVSYGIDALGLRHSPPAASNAPCLVFFGCSYAFGEGVNDDETLAWQVWWHANGKWATRNLGFHGYGPHHMLAMLQSGRVENALGGSVAAGAVYVLLPDHARRCAGEAVWARAAPKFVVGPDGRATREGRYGPAAEPGTLGLWLRWETSKSSIGRLLLRDRRRGIPSDQLALLVAIVGTARDEWGQRFPGAPFLVLLWDGGTRDDARIHAALARRGIRVGRVSSMLPGWPADRRRWLLPGDPHPTAAAYRLVAAGVLKWCRLGRD